MRCTPSWCCCGWSSRPMALLLWELRISRRTASASSTRHWRISMASPPAPSMAGRTTTRLIAAGDPAAKIAAVARDENVDLIVMATHGSGGLTRLTMGSVATSVLHRAATPMLLVRSVATHPSTAGKANEPSARTVTVI